VGCHCACFTDRATAESCVGLTAVQSSRACPETRRRVQKFKVRLAAVSSSSSTAFARFKSFKRFNRAPLRSSAKHSCNRFRLTTRGLSDSLSARLARGEIIMDQRAAEIHDGLKHPVIDGDG